MLKNVELPSLDELLNRSSAIQRGSVKNEYEILTPPARILIPLCDTATKEIIDINPNAIINEVRILTGRMNNESVDRVVKNILRPAALAIRNENPGSHLIFCHTWQTNIGNFFTGDNYVEYEHIAISINTYLADITRKIVLYLGGYISESTNKLIRMTD